MPGAGYNAQTHCSCTMVCGALSCGGDRHRQPVLTPLPQKPAPHTPVPGLTFPLPWWLVCLSQVQHAIDNAAKVQQELLVLLCLEGAGFMILAVFLIMRLLRSISVHRQALFSVFLAVPHTYLRTLASKSVSIGDEDAEEDEGERAPCSQGGVCCVLL